MTQSVLGEQAATASEERSYAVPPMPPNESERLEDLYALKILDTETEERFDRYTRLAADILDVPIALISLIDKDRQWFKSACGLTLSQTPREVSFCAHAIAGGDILVIPDAAEDLRFAENPLVKGEPNIRFYAGAVIRGPSGQPLGTCCVIDRRPRHLTEREERLLRQLGRLVEREMQAGLELVEIRERLQEQALFDPVSGLATRALFRDRLGQAVASSEKSGKRLLVALVKVDRFGVLHDALGAVASARLLGEIGIRLSQAMGTRCVLGRWQDDEVAVLLPLATDEPAADTAVRKLLACFEAPLTSGGRSVAVGVSVGASVCPEDGAEADALIQMAKTALRASPARERSRYRLYTGELRSQFARRFEMEAGLQAALADNELRLVFQPKVELGAGRISAMEALVRWTSPKLGAVSPVEFIPIAEETGLIGELGNWVLRTACEQSRRWQDAGYPALPVGVNVTSFQLRQPDFKAQVRQALDGAGLDGTHLDLEITESSLVDDIEGAIAIMRDLAASGITFSIDDFGTGFSSLSYLRRMPIRVLKIDRAFIQEMTSNPVDATIAHTVIALAHGLGIKAVAEGVETREQLVFLRAYRCDEIQGYLFSPPVPPDAFAALLSEDRRLAL